MRLKRVTWNEATTGHLSAAQRLALRAIHASGGRFDYVESLAGGRTLWVIKYA